MNFPFLRTPPGPPRRRFFPQSRSPVLLPPHPPPGLLLRDASWPERATKAEKKRARIEILHTCPSASSWRTTLLFRKETPLCRSPSLCPCLCVSFFFFGSFSAASAGRRRGRVAREHLGRGLVPTLQKGEGLQDRRSAPLCRDHSLSRLLEGRPKTLDRTMTTVLTQRRVLTNKKKKREGGGVDERTKKKGEVLCLCMCGGVWESSSSSSLLRSPHPPQTPPPLPLLLPTRPPRLVVVFFFFFFGRLLFHLWCVGRILACPKEVLVWFLVLGETAR